MKVGTEIDNNFGYEKITQLVDNIPLTIFEIRLPNKVRNVNTSMLHFFLKFYLERI